MQQTFIIISSLLALISPIVYAERIIRGKVRPHRTTRIVLLVTTLITVVSLYLQGSTVAIWLALVSAIQSTFIFVLSVRYGMGGWARIDIISLIAAVIGIILWQVTDNPVVALYFAIGADAIGMVPAIIKTYKLPQTESWAFFLLDTFAAVFSIVGINTGGFKEYAFPAYLLLINFLMVAIIIIPRKRN